MSGEWLTLGAIRHSCAKPDDGKIALARADVGALWKCHECGLVWELGRLEKYGDDDMWAWTEYSQGEGWR